MTKYARFRNNNNIVTIDDQLKAYVYLGKIFLVNPDKYPPSGQDSRYPIYLDFLCIGYPIIYFSLPHGLSQAESTINGGIYRYSAYITGLINLGSNSWRVWVVMTQPINQSSIDWTLIVRVFGRLDLNYSSPNSSAHARFRIKNDLQQVIFDSDSRMLRLAGNTYDSELVLGKLTPDPGTPSQYDTSFSMPFDMANKSICMTTRGVLYQPQYYGQYQDFDTGRQIYQYHSINWATGFWSSGSTLVARKIGNYGEDFETTGAVSVIDYSGANLVYTRLSVIDNSQFP